ncbi:MAG TPA: DEAD/DEAH box helicase [Phycisphaerales bacterium]|nr:DEAD/DEAH box helicase [Phycisphaerales bacterium]
MIVLHANWWNGSLRLWAERQPGGAEIGKADGGSHPYAWPGAALREKLAVLTHTDAALAGLADPQSIDLQLPTRESAPLPSPRLAHATGHIAHLVNGSRAQVELKPWRVETIAIDPARAPTLLEQLEEAASRADDDLAADAPEGHAGFALADSTVFFAAAARLALSLVADQRFVPTAEGAGVGGVNGETRAAWRPWLGEERAEQRIRALIASMPPSARSAGPDPAGQQPADVLDAFLTSTVDAVCRAALLRESMVEAVESWRETKGADDAHSAWLSGLLAADNHVAGDSPMHTVVVRQSRRWVSGLEERGTSGAWRLCLHLHEPAPSLKIPDLATPSDDVRWSLTFHLQSIESPDSLIDAEDVWSLRAESATVGGRRIDAPQELLLAELGRAIRLYPKLESALDESEPVSMELTTKQAYEFLREIKPILIEQGFGVIAPEWWETPSARLGARLRLFSDDDASGDSASAPGAVAPAKLGLSALVGYEWKIAIGDTPLTLEEFERLASQRSPLVRVGGKWVEVRPEDIRAAVEFIRANPGGQMRVGDALRIAFTADQERTGVSVLGLDAEGWIGTVLGGADGTAKMPMLQPPDSFRGELRPYQLKGLSWLMFLDRLGFGPCLADDMGLGKTIQLLAMLLAERENARASGTPLAGPTLLVVPMSIVGNWTREAGRFAPTLRVLVHHGPTRLTGDALTRGAIESDLIITTYALAHRDRDALGEIPWGRIVLDEAQNVKNAAAKQSQALRSLEAPRRVALTGTPLENRLSELWSIMDFCNPGLLGSAGDFRRGFAIPVERHHDRERAKQLRSLVRPFLLRRLKTDPSVISDLPDKVETKEFCRLTSEQASLYEQCVKTMLGEVDRAEGIRRRGIVLTTLVRLKQICNHPAQLADGALFKAPQTTEPVVESDEETDLPADIARSGKCIRLIEMLDEVIASGEKALVFTQFRRMGSILASMLRKSFDREILFLHGGTTQKQREQMIDLFQTQTDRHPVFVLSLKAGGVGLNLTAASHVFHFDRWWNPAVENQATDRAFRIGQTRAVSVHKFVVTGTLEERIDQMIESKIALAEDVIGSGEDWLTELSTDQLRDVLALRPDALADED